MFGRKARLRRYRRLLTEIPLVVADSRNTATQLAQCWRKLRYTDFVALPPTLRIHQEMRLYYPNLPSLTQALKLTNQWITEERDLRLEQELTRRKEQADVVSLDFWLADDDAIPIDEAHYYRRLAGLLQAHHTLVSQQSTEYYHRMSELLYADLVIVTHTLVNALIEKETLM